MNGTPNAHEYGDSGKYPPAVEIEERPDGCLILRCPYPPRPRARSIPQILLERSQAHPSRTLLAERSTNDGEWRHLTYADAAERCRNVAQCLLDRGLTPSDCIMVLSPRSFGHFALAYGAMIAQVPVSPISPPYSLLSTDHVKLKHVTSLLRPSLVMVDDLTSYRPALESLLVAGLLDGVEIVIARQTESAPETWNGLSVSTIDSWYDNEAGSAVERSLNNIDHGTVARYMFTSGSTGMPKAVVYTQGMMCAQMAQAAGLDRPSGVVDSASAPRILDWMPWSHTGAGVMRLNAMIYSGGSIYFDAGIPVAGAYEETLRNLREVLPTTLSGAPIGYSMLADALERDDELNRMVFSNVKAVNFGSAAMPVSLFERIQRLSERATGRRVSIASSLASTEVIGCLSAYWPMEDADNLGLPIPGAVVKLHPNGGKWELRVKSNTVTPGYHKDPQKTAESFDEEGFFKMGDAVRFIDPGDPARGLAFDGRIAEQFKLVTGTWVSAGTLRSQIVAATSPIVQDAVVCGLNQNYVAVMVWPNVSACTKQLGLDESTPIKTTIEAILTAPELRQRIRQGLRAHNEANPGSSTRVARFIVLDEPPSVDALEITEKGYVNQGRVLERRAAIVERLYAEPPGPGVELLN